MWRLLRADIKIYTYISQKDVKYINYKVSRRPQML